MCVTSAPGLVSLLGSIKCTQKFVVIGCLLISNSGREFLIIWQLSSAMGLFNSSTVFKISVFGSHLISEKVRISASIKHLQNDLCEDRNPCSFLWFWFQAHWKMWMGACWLLLVTNQAVSGTCCSFTIILDLGLTA